MATDSIGKRPNADGGWRNNVLFCAASVLAFWGPVVAILTLTTRRLSENPLAYLGGYLALSAIVAGPIFGVRAIVRADTPRREVVSWLACLLASAPALGIAFALFVAILSL